jgi:hypothetical protein
MHESMIAQKLETMSEICNFPLTKVELRAFFLFTSIRNGYIDAYRTVPNDDVFCSLHATRNLLLAES